MAKSDSVFIYIGTYPSEASAQADYDVIKDLHTAGGIGTYDASVVTKDIGGKVHVNKDEMATRHGAWGGAAVGASSALFSHPPSSPPRRPVLLSAELAATSGGGCRAADVKEFGDVIDAGQAALVVVGESTIEDAFNKAGLKAEKQVAKELDVNPKDIDQAVQEAASELG